MGERSQPGDGSAGEGEGGRRHRRAVGPPGARPSGAEPRPEPRDDPAARDDLAAPDDPAAPDDNERFLADRPPHHDRER